ncbi:TPA: NUDIX domain-containing protein [Serratia fonticola]
MSDSKQIHIAAAVITDKAGRILLVRKRNTVWFMQPGGKIESGERPEVALARELKEELNVCISPDEMIPLGRFTDLAANEPGHMLFADMFKVRTAETHFLPSAEIEEVIWFDPSGNHPYQLAPLTKNHILSLLDR